MHEPMAHCGRMTKPELICHLIAAVLREWTRIQTETENGGHVEGNSMEPSPPGGHPSSPWNNSSHADEAKIHPGTYSVLKT